MSASRRAGEWHGGIIAFGVAELTLLVSLGWWPEANFPAPGLLIFAGAFGAYALAAGLAARDSGSATPIWILAVLMHHR